MIPFFVVDRPASLEILKGIFVKYPNLSFGLMTHASVSPKFVDIFASFPYKTPLKYFNEDIDEKTMNRMIKNNIVKISDSCVFQKNGCSYSYEELFEKYVKLKVHFGIIKDVLHDKEKTLKSAEEAINIYEDGKYGKKFKLLGVAQGKTVEEYCQCYEELLDMGYEYIALGGFLKRNGNSNYVKVNNEKFLEMVVSTINSKFHPKQLFVLGVYGPKRHKLLEKLGVWGADYKGWLFHYDEYYTKGMQKLKEQGKLNEHIKLCYKNFLSSKFLYLKNRSPENRTTFWNSRKKLNSALKEVNSSLQELRYIEIREFIEKEIIHKFLIKDEF